MAASDGDAVESEKAWDVVVEGDARRDMGTVISGVITWVRAGGKGRTLADAERRLRAEGRNTFLFGAKAVEGKHVTCSLHGTEPTEFYLESSTELAPAARAYGARFVASESENLKRLEVAGCLTWDPDAAKASKGVLALIPAEAPGAVLEVLCNADPAAPRDQAVAMAEMICARLARAPQCIVTVGASRFTMLPGPESAAAVKQAVAKLREEGARTGTGAT